MSKSQRCASAPPCTTLSVFLLPNFEEMLHRAFRRITLSPTNALTKNFTLKHLKSLRMLPQHPVNVKELFCECFLK